MIKNLVFLIAGIVIGFGVCQSLISKSEPWIPVIEGTSFTYLTDSITDAVEAVKSAKDNIQAVKKSKAEVELHEAIDLLLKLKSYYIPMTEIRQLIYDADRLFYLKRYDQTKQKLNEAKKLLLEVGHSDVPSLEKVARESILMLDELILAIDTSPKTASKIFQDVGHHINLMLLKGELIFEGSEFDEQSQ